MNISEKGAEGFDFEILLKSAFFPDTFGCARLSENKFSLRSRLHESSRHGKAQTSLALLIWLNENVRFQV